MLLPIGCTMGKVKSTGALKVEAGRSIYGEETVATLPEDFQRLSPKHKIMVCEIVWVLLRAEKR